MHIIGTAGHVDHGKSSLVAALTGTNPDRWIEEQLRGMTLDLGFAHLQLEPNLEAGIVDVPGHERFLHNMLAGAAGMELLLLVVAANEGVMPQTREHLCILQYLNVRRSIVVVTKIDLLNSVDRSAALASIKAALAHSLVADADVIGVSTLSGEGLDALRSAIARELRALPVRSKDAPAFLPIDRVFALPGHGTIVTGTLMQGRLAVGDQIQIAPHGHALRIRGLHTFGQARKNVEAGSRVAVNLPGVDTTEIARGDVLADPQFGSSTVFSASFTPLPESVGLLRRRNPVRAYIGSAEILGTLVFENVPVAAESVSGVLHLRTAVSTYPHESYVVRRMSPKTLLGGGTLLGAGAVSVASEVVPAEDAIEAVLAASGLEPLSLAQIASRANMREDVAQANLEGLLEGKRAFAISKPAAYVDAGAAQQLLARLNTYLTALQAEHPWILGSTSLALCRDFGMPEERLIRFLGAFAEDGQIAARNGYYATTEHVAQLTAEQRLFFETCIAVDPQNPHLPVSLPDVLQAMRDCKITGISQAFDTLVVRGAVIKVGEDLYRGTQIAAIHARVETYLRAEKQITMAQFRDLLGTSRKFAVPLLEWFDARGITVRSGDFRMLRTKRAS
ncbi:MAG: selenocysteine-specific translation elongation factor [Candidatus Eremiobacteraeota bacterium]|nr:selenocysteine-specific translation elongation factor [Candidatus Eremiobacteraeota bacterium]